MLLLSASSVLVLIPIDATWQQLRPLRPQKLLSVAFTDVCVSVLWVVHPRLQVTDTPGLLNRAEEDRNAMERLTVACMAFLPTSVLFVMDLTGQCGTSPSTQWQIRADLRARFPDKPWLDVFTKQDLLLEVHAQTQAARDQAGRGGAADNDATSAASQQTKNSQASGSGHALHVSNSEDLRMEGASKEAPTRAV